MTKVLLVGDVHLRDRPPINRRPNYTQQILDKLQFCVDKANELDVPLIQAGDLFDFKRPDRNSHRLVQQTHDVLKQVDRGVWIVPGNHDLSHDRLESLPEQPLGALARMSNVKLLVGTDDALPGIAGIPYLTEFDGGLWRYAIEEWNYAIEEPQLLVTHAPLFPPGQAPEVYASIDPDDWAELFIGIPATYYGHIHESHGTYTDTNDYMQFCNQGALSRSSAHEQTINRKPAITLWDGGSFERIEVPHLPASEVFLFEQVEAKQEAKISAAEFTDAVNSVVLSGLSTEAVLDYVRQAGATKAALHQVENILEESE